MKKNTLGVTMARSSLSSSQFLLIQIMAPACSSLTLRNLQISCTTLGISRIVLRDLLLVHGADEFRD